tara:strand:+ start:21521 stop:22018 length:498 start_codon:yes stop_codon:yes gene_type:complete
LKVLNIHTRIIEQPKAQLADCLATLSKPNDNLWPSEQWPAMRFKKGIEVGAKGGHGPIRYTVEEYDPSKCIQFRFTNPKGFDGIHKLELKEITNNKTQITHTIAMKTSGKATFNWIFAIRALHNALIEDGFDKLENKFSKDTKRSEWNWWVKLLRKQLAKKVAKI